MNRLRNPKVGWGLVILTLTLLSFVPVQPALADVAPPAEPPGSTTPLPMRTSIALYTATPLPTPSPALAQLSTPDATPPSTAVKAATVTPLSSTPSTAFPTTFIASAFLVGLCIIVLVALNGVGLAVWYLRRDVKRSQNTGRITKNDGSS